MNGPVRPSVRLMSIHHTFLQRPSHHIIIKYSRVRISDKGDVHTKVWNQRWKIKVTAVNIQFAPIWAIPDRNSSLNFTDICKMTHIASRVIEEMSCYFSISSIKFQGHTDKKIHDLAPIWVFPTITQSRLKWHKSIWQHGRVSLLSSVVICRRKVTRAKKKTIDPIETYADDNFSFNSIHKWLCNYTQNCEEVHYFFSRSPIPYQGQSWRHNFWGFGINK